MNEFQCSGCHRVWPELSDQYAVMDAVGECIACCVKAGRDFPLGVCYEARDRRAELVAAAFHAWLVEVQEVYYG